MENFTHFNDKGLAHVVDVGQKEVTKRMARAQAVIEMQVSTLQKIKNSGINKGNVLGVAQVGGIMGAKQTAGIIPMCHNIFISSIDIDFEIDDINSRIKIICTAKCEGQTGIEMEALTGATVAALTIYDMCKAVDRSMIIKDVGLIEKLGGKSGHFINDRI